MTLKITLHENFRNTNRNIGSRHRRPTYQSGTYSPFLSTNVNTAQGASQACRPRAVI